MWSHVNLNKADSRVLCEIRSARVYKIFIDAVKISLTVVLLHALPHILIYIPLYTKHARACQRQDSFNLHNSFFSLLSDQCISNISNIYNPDVNLRLASQTIWDHMFSDPKSDYIFSYFQLPTWLIFRFFSYVVIFYLFLR